MIVLPYACLQSILSYLKPLIGLKSRDLDLAINDCANANGSLAWLFKPLPGKHSKCCHHPLLVKIQWQQDATMASMYIAVVFQMLLPAVKGWLQQLQPG